MPPHAPARLHPEPSWSILAVNRLELEPATRHVAAGGWRRAVVGLLVGAAAGAAVALVLPRDEGPRRTIRAGDRPRPYED